MRVSLVDAVIHVNELYVHASVQKLMTLYYHSECLSILSHPFNRRSEFEKFRFRHEEYDARRTGNAAGRAIT